MRAAKKPAWKLFDRLSIRLEAGLALRHSDSSKVLELVKNTVREQSPKDREGILQQLKQEEEEKNEPKKSPSTAPASPEKKYSLIKKKVRRFSVNAKPAKEGKRPRRSVKRPKSSKKHSSSNQA